MLQLHFSLLQAAMWMAAGMNLPAVPVGRQVANEKPPADGTQLRGYATPRELPQRLQIHHLQITHLILMSVCQLLVIVVAEQVRMQ